MKHLIEINYKSGNSIRLWFKKFNLQKSIEGKIHRIDWELDDWNEFNSIIYLGIDNIESLFLIESKENDDN